MVLGLKVRRFRKIVIKIIRATRNETHVNPKYKGESPAGFYVDGVSNHSHVQVYAPPICGQYNNTTRTGVRKRIRSCRLDVNVVGSNLSHRRSVSLTANPLLAARPVFR